MGRDDASAKLHIFAAGLLPEACAIAADQWKFTNGERPLAFMFSITKAGSPGFWKFLGDRLIDTQGTSTPARQRLDAVESVIFDPDLRLIEQI